MKIVKALKTTLLSPFSSTDTSLVVSKFVDSKGNELAMADFGDFGVVVLKQGTIVEMVKFSAISQSSTGTAATLTVASSGRHINPTSPYAGSGTGEDFQAGAEVLVSNDPLTLSRFGNLDVAGTFTKQMNFTLIPTTDGGNATSDNQLVRYAQVLALLTGSATVNRIVIAGTGGAVLVAGDHVYLDVTDGEWKLIDADTAATVEGSMKGIAQGAGTDGGSISGGVLIPIGLDSNQSGLTPNTTYYYSDTAGDISTTPGTKEVTAGYALSATTFLLYPGFNQQITEDIQDALAGAGTAVPSASNKYVLEDYRLFSPIGMISPYAGFSAPSGWLLANGSAVSRSTYSALFEVLNPSLGTATITIASPGVVTCTGHGLVLDDQVYFTTTGALPTGLTADTRYYVISAGLTADAFQVSATKAGSVVNTSGSQSGVHTLRRSPYGVGDGSTTFTLPDLRGLVPVGRDSTQTEFNAVAETGGSKTHTLTTAEIPAHTHTLATDSKGSHTSGGGQPQASDNSGTPQSATIGTEGGGGAHNNLQPYIALNYIIKI